MASYTDSNGALSPEFNQAVSIYMFVWFIISVLYTVAAYKSTWMVFIDLIMVDICLLLLACGFMVGNQGVLTAGYSFGMVVSFLSCESFCHAHAMKNLLTRTQTGVVALRCGPIQPPSSFRCSQLVLSKPDTWCGTI